MEGGVRLVQYEHIRRCMGQMVICHTRQGSIHGRLLGCNSTHLFMQFSQYRMVSDEGNQTPQVVHSFGNDSDVITNVYFGYGRTAVAIASVVGLTAIGLSALRW
jgi:hypothetical protein